MTPLLMLGISLAGGLGAVCRFVLDGIIRSRVTSSMPWGTFTINLTGSFLLGLITGLATTQFLPETVHLIVGAGFLGGYTTFSTASFESIRLLQERKWVEGFLSGIGLVVAATAAAVLGLWLGGLP